MVYITGLTIKLNRDDLEILNKGMTIEKNFVTIIPQRDVTEIKPNGKKKVK